jgi:acetolactate synthase small subunit
MERASKAAAGVQQIIKRLNKVLDVKRVSQAHIHKSVTKDEVIMVQDLRKIKPFEIKPFERKP